jgi:hypothetical protein
MSSATVSFQRRARLRWSAGRRVRITGTPEARAARYRAWRSASVMALSPMALAGMDPLRSVTSRNPCHTESGSGAVFEPPAVIAGLDDVTMVGEAVE